MRRNRFISRARHNADAETLAKLARRLSESGTRIEDRIWERRLIELIEDRISRGFADAIDAALDDLAKSDPRAYEDLADLAESCAESAVIEIDGKPHDALLVVIPLLAWSRYKLPAASLSPGVIDNIAVQITGHLAARDARLAVADYLFSIDQLPESFGEVRDMADRLFAAAAQAKPGSSSRDATRLQIDAKSLREPVAMLADTRYVLAAIVVPGGGPLYHWQETGVDPDARAGAIEAFRGQVEKVLMPALTGCRFSVRAPTAFHSGLREADRDLRGFSLEAAVAFLKLVHELGPGTLQATVAAFEDKRNQTLAEYRIGISTQADDDAVVEGVVWPLLGDDEDGVQEEIEAALRALGITRVVTHPQRFPLEYCDDCGAPMFPNAAGHAVHAEAPETSEEQPTHPLH
jgi:hypothetical protein